MSVLRFCLSGLLTFLSLTSGLTVVLRQTATIPCNRSCSAVEWFRKKMKSLNPVCSFREGNFSVAPEFKDRIEFYEANLRQGNASLIIDNIVYNDRSWYVCSCDGEKVCDHFLEVLGKFYRRSSSDVHHARSTIFIWSNLVFSCVATFRLCCNWLSHRAGSSS